MFNSRYSRGQRRWRRSARSIWRRGQLLSTTMLAGLAVALASTNGYAQTVVTNGTSVVSSDAQLGGNSVTVDNASNGNATLQINSGVSIGNRVLVNNKGTLNNSGTILRSGRDQRAIETTAGGATVNNTGGVLRATGVGGVAVLINRGVGTVSNLNGGIIAGGDMGIGLGGGGTVSNTGAGSTISASAANSSGIYSSSVAVDVTNTAGATITGRQSGMYLGAGGTVTNDGPSSRISADADGSVGVSIGGDANKSGILRNTGGATIQGANGGVVLYGGGEVFNGVGSVIKANTAVIVISGDTKLANQGQLIGSVNLNFNSPARTHQVTLFTGSSITGNLGIGSNGASTLTLDGAGDQLYSTAVTGNTSFNTGRLIKQGLGTWTLDQAMTRGGATQINAGTIAVANNSGLGTGVATVDNGGNLGANLAIGSGVAISNDIIVSNGGTLNNAGTITRTAAGQQGVRSTVGAATVNNLKGATIIGDGNAVATGLGAMVNNTGGSITSNNASGVVIGGGVVTNTEGGTIAGKGTTVIAFEDGVVSNVGSTIRSTGGYGVEIHGKATVANTKGGTIIGQRVGVYLSGGGALTNDASSTIEGVGGSAVASASGGTVILSNAGKLIGGVALASSAANEAHLVTLYTGSSITGNLGMNTTASTLTLDGGGDQLYSKAVTGTTTFKGSLIKQGSGSWTLDQTQNGLTSGNTSIEGGTLNVSTLLNSAKVDVLSGATLTGKGTLVGAVDIADGGHLALRSGSTLSAASLVLNANSNLDVALGAPSGARLLSLSGNLTLGGKLNIADLGGFGAGVYRLIDYAGALTDNGLDIGVRPVGVKPDGLAIQTSVAKQVNLISSTGATLGFWDGGNAALHDNRTINGGDGVWSAGGRNWTDANGLLNGPFQPNPSFAVFQATSGTVTVDALGGAIAVTGMQFASDGYEIKGDAIALQGIGGESIVRVGTGLEIDAGMSATIGTKLTGAGKLVKTDYGQLILSGANSYAGGTRIDGGILQVSADTSLGATSGGLAFNGGALATTGTFDTSRAVTLTRAGSFDVAAGTGLGLTGIVSGNGDLVKTGSGVLRLDNAGNAYGNTLVEAGTLIGNASSISGSIGNAGTVVFDQTSDASFAGGIVGLGGIKGTMFKNGAGNLSLAGTSTLDWSIQSGGLTTAAERFGGNAFIGSGASFIFNQSANADYSGLISGSGNFVKAGTGGLSLTGDSAAFAGSTNVDAGLLAVNGKLGGSMVVGAGGTLGGSGTAGSGAGSLITIASGGTIAPGNSIGTLIVNGDLVFATGSRFAVEVDPNGMGSDLVKVTGNATINGGSVAHIGANGNYKLRSSYTILSAGGGLSGKFDGVTSNFAFLTPSLSYDYAGRTVDLNLDRNDAAFAASALTRNQIATADGIDSIGMDARHPVYDAIVQLPDDKALIRGSFDQLSGEIHASAKTALIEDSHFVRDAATDRLRAAFGDVGAGSMPVMAYGEGGVSLAAPTTDRFAIWGQGFGSWGTTDSDGNAGTLKRSTGGFLMGADAPVFDTWRLGVLAGFSHTSFDVTDRASSGDSDNYHLGLYGGTSWNIVGGALGFRTGLAYSWNDMNTSRSVAFPGLSDSLKDNYNAGTLQTFGELGYRIDTAAAAFEPFANLAYVSLRSGDFAEQSGAAALHADGQMTDTTFTTLGLRASTSLDLGDMNLAARGTLGWRHAYGDTTPLATQAFSAGNAFTVAGVPIAKDAALVEAGLDIAITQQASFGLSYDGQIAAGAQQHGFKANLNVRF